MVEHRSPKPGAGGSSPSWPAIHILHLLAGVGRERNGRDVTMSGVIGFWDQSRTFLTQVRNELERVTWPSKKEVYATTFVVILTSIFFGMYLWGIDLLLNVLVGWVFNAFGVA